jgi:Flp pilus assembly protein TadD
MSERWIRLLSPLALLALFALAGRGLPSRAKAPTAPIDCDRASRRDLPTLRKCVAMEPDDIELMTELAASFESAGEWDKAEAEYRHALAIDPEDGDVQIALGRVLLQRGDKAGARREAAGALKVQPGSRPAESLLRRADAAEGAGQ